MTEKSCVKKALVLGVTGQDGAYLADHLLKLNYKVYGSSRDAQTCNTSCLKRLKVENKINLISIAPSDFRSVITAISQTNPDEIYNLSGQTSVGLSFSQPVECIDSIVTANINILESIKILNKNIKLFLAGSSESYGDTGTERANEKTPMKPKSPYGAAKAAAFWNARIYREAYDMHVCTGILANHESPLRGKRFVTQKIIQGAIGIANGEMEKLELGNLEITRNWGWAPDYVKAMHLMLQSVNPEDYVIASEKSTTLKEFVKKTFETVGLEWEKYTCTNNNLKRPADIKQSYLNADKIRKELGWSTDKNLDDIIKKMCRGELY